MRTFGIEEEFFLIDPATQLPAVPRHGLYNALMAQGTAGSRTHPELLACQVETSTPVCTGREQALDAVASARRALADTAADGGLQLLGLGTPPRIAAVPAIIHASDRYRAMNEFCPGLTSEHYIGGTHVHVGVQSRAEGVAALNALRPWLPLLTALGANSPFWRGVDSGFASWRSIQYRRWSVSGIPPHFASEQDYARRLGFLLDADSVLDARHICWVARLSARYPTVEIRVADAQLGATESVVLALLMRALVEAGLRARPSSVPPQEALELSAWQAAKVGVRGNQYDPATGTPCSLDRAVRGLLEHIDAELGATGDAEAVHTGLARILEHGNGAVAQRRYFREGGFEKLLAEAGARIAD